MTAVRNFATIAGFTGVSGNVTARMFVYGVSQKKFNLKKYQNFMLVVPKSLLNKKVWKLKIK